MMPVPSTQDAVSKVLVRERLVITGERCGLLRSLAVLTKGRPVYDDDVAGMLPGFTKVCTGSGRLGVHHNAAM